MAVILEIENPGVKLAVDVKSKKPDAQLAARLAVKKFRLVIQCKTTNNCMVSL